MSKRKKEYVELHEVAQWLAGRRNMSVVQASKLIVPRAQCGGCRNHFSNGRNGHLHFVTRDGKLEILCGRCFAQSLFLGQVAPVSFRRFGEGEVIRKLVGQRFAEKINREACRHYHSGGKPNRRVKRRTLQFC